MQLSICCSASASGTAKQLAERLERNLGIRTLLVEEDAAPVSETWEEGAAADAVLILLDRISAPAPLRREAWSGLIDHDGSPPVAFAKLEECAYPKLLERRPFFPAGDAVALDRAVERWVAAMLPKRPGIEPAPVAAAIPEEWWGQLADRPGHVETNDADSAQAFARAARGHFQSVVWIGCADRETALIRAELEHRAGDGRALVVLAHIDKPLPPPAGRHSYIQVRGALPAGGEDAALGACYGPGFPGSLARELGGDVTRAVLLDERNGTYRLREVPRTDPATRQRHLEILQRHFQHWRHEPEPCRALLAEAPAAIQHGFGHDWARGAELCRRVAFLLLAEGRRREGIRMFHRLLLEAEAHGDTETAADALHELSWLTDEDAPAPSGTAVAEQLSFDLMA